MDQFSNALYSEQLLLQYDYQILLFVPIFQTNYRYKKIAKSKFIGSGNSLVKDFEICGELRSLFNPPRSWLTKKILLHINDERDSLLILYFGLI